MNKKNIKGIDKTGNRIQQLLDLSYLKTFYTRPDNKKILDLSTQKIHKSIDDIMGNVNSSIGFNNVSMLYSRIGEHIKDDNFAKSIEKQFSTDQGMQNIDNVMSLYVENKHIKDIEREIDIICKYMPMLEDSIEFKQDLILSSDDLKKDFLSFKNKKNTIEDILANVEFIKNEHSLEDTIKEICYNTAKYGEEFYSVIPYSKLISSELEKKSHVNISLSENTLYIDDKQELIITENCGIDSLEISIDRNSYPDFMINEAKQIKAKFNSVFDNNSKIDLIPDNTLDGLVTKDKKENEVNINGCYVKRLERSRIIPLYIENTCLGYYYIDVEDESDFNNFVDNLNDPMGGMKKNRIDVSNSEMAIKDKLLQNISGKIVNAIDSTFINNNQNLKKEIYLLMKYSLDRNNSNLRFSIKFLQPNEVYHFYFKKNPKTHRGISDLQRSIVPAKLYCSLIISNVFGILTRGQDKRVYYVKQSIDTNIAQLMLNTINQIKKSNFGLRELNNLETILNMTGRFNDYIIPVNGSGDSPINFEIMSGQDIPIKTELLEMLESMAINSTGIPIEILQMRRNQVDFAIQVNSTNTKVLRHAINRQAKVQRMLSPFVSQIYNYTFSENENIKIMLPPAFHANMDNTTAMIENTINYTNALAVIEYGDNPDEDVEREIRIFKRITARQILGSMINPDMIDFNKEQAKMLASVDKPNKEEEE